MSQEKRIFSMFVETPMLITVRQRVGVEAIDREEAMERVFDGDYDVDAYEGAFGEICTELKESRIQLHDDEPDPNREIYIDEASILDEGPA